MSVGFTITKSLVDDTFAKQMTSVLCIQRFNGADLKRCKDNGLNMGAPWVRNNLNYAPTTTSPNTTYKFRSSNEWVKPKRAVKYVAMVGATTATGSLATMIALFKTGNFEVPGFDKSATLPWVANPGGATTATPLSSTYPSTADVNVQFSSQTHMGMVQSAAVFYCALGYIERQLDPDTSANRNCGTIPKPIVTCWVARSF